MMRLSKFVFLALAMFTAFDCHASQPDLRPIQHRFVELGVGKEQIHIQSLDQWQAFWRRFSTSRPPNIDFQHHDVLVVLMGTQGSGGYSIRIKDVVARQLGTDVKVLLCSPPRGSAQVGEITSPYDTMLTPKLATPIEWLMVEGRTGNLPCR